MKRLENLQKILDEVLDDYGWTLKYDVSDYSKIDMYKDDFIKLFLEKCCGDLLLEGTDEFSIVERIKNV